MAGEDELDILRKAPPPASPARREAALRAALEAFGEIPSVPTQASGSRERLIARAMEAWRGLMDRKLIAAPALAALIGLPLASYVALDLVGRQGSASFERAAVPLPEPAMPSEPEPRQDAEGAPPAPPVAAKPKMERRQREGSVAPAQPKLKAPAAPAPATMAEADLAPPPAAGDRIAGFSTNTVHSVQQEPVSTFSIDVDTASYAYVRRSLEEGVLPAAETVRVEELINYFPYDWPGPADRATPFRTTVSVMPTPWNVGTRLMHVAIKGFDIAPAQRPRANLVFLIDVSGSMDAPDKLPLLRSAFRLLLTTLAPEDTVSIVTYAGNAGTVLEPTRASDRQAILDAIDRLEPGGATAGAEGIEEAYRLAQKSFVASGVNRVMLATDGDFNVGQSDDDALKRLVEQKRESGVFLSVLGFGRGNLNDQMMQVLAQNGNGTAAYVDTLAEAEKVLVEDAASTLFPIAKDVKIQVEFNPATVSEYRLIGYETRALNREDFNNDRVDAGEIGSGASVTAIYEVTPKGSPAAALEPLRYEDAPRSEPTAPAHGDEYAFVKIRYKLPDASASKLIETPVTEADAVPAFDDASGDQRFSVAVAAFGQKLRNEDATAKLSWDEIARIAAAARGGDHFGYRAEFLSLARLASALGVKGEGAP